MDENHSGRLKWLEMALCVTSFLLTRTRICHENMPKTTRLATLAHCAAFDEPPPDDEPDP